MQNMLADNVQEIDCANELVRLRLDKKRKLEVIEKRTIGQVRKKIKQEKEEKAQGLLGLFFRKKKNRRAMILDYLSEKNNSVIQLNAENIGSQMALRGLSYDGAEEDLSGDEREEKEKMAAAQKAKEGEEARAKNAEAQKKQRIAEAIKKLLHKAKMWSINAALGTFGLSLLVTIFIWIGQFVGRYLFKIEMLPGFDEKDLLMMLCFAFIFAIIVTPIVAFVSMLDTLGLI